MQEAANEDDINYEVVKQKSLSVDLEFPPAPPFGVAPVACHKLFPAPQAGGSHGKTALLCAAHCP